MCKHQHVLHAGTHAHNANAQTYRHSTNAHMHTKYVHQTSYVSTTKLLTIYLYYDTYVHYYYLQVLWPYLLEFLIPEQYTRGFGMLTRCIHHIASKKKTEEAEDYELDYEVSG